jgi:hypothetical protein
MRAWFFGIVLALATQPAAAQSTPERYVCPPTRQLNCMPIVPAERRAFCRKDYREWATRNCPGFKVLHQWCVIQIEGFCKLRGFMRTGGPRSASNL